MGDYVVKTLILLTTWNGARFLPGQLDSIRSQTDPDFEVLVQDDGSADETLRQLDTVCRGDIRFLRGKEEGLHLGAVGNFLSLIRQADADVILLSDQDDVWLPEKVSALKQALAEAEQVHGPDTPLLVHSDCKLIDGQGLLLADSFFRHQGWDPAATDLPRLLVQNNVTGCTLIMNRPLRDLIAEYGRPELLFMHDWFIALTAAAFGRVFFLNRPLTLYRQHGENTVGASSRHQLSRGVEALSQREKARRRIALTYEHTQAFREAYGSRLPEEADRLTEAYLATRSLPRRSRLLQIRKLGCVMQSPVTRAGQLIFG